MKLDVCANHTTLDFKLFEGTKEEGEEVVGKGKCQHLIV